MLAFSAAVEGLVDEAVVRRLLAEAGVTTSAVYGKNGKAHLLSRLPSYNQAAELAPWLVVVDLDDSAECAPPARARWLPNPASKMCFRIAVREIEAWLLADREALAAFFGIPVARVPQDPEAIADPKRTVVGLAALSRRREIRQDMVPRPESNREVGPAYSSRLIEFVQTQWRPDVAAMHSTSLRGLRRRLEQIVVSVQGG